MYWNNWTIENKYTNCHNRLTSVWWFNTPKWLMYIGMKVFIYLYNMLQPIVTCVWNLHVQVGTLHSILCHSSQKGVWLRGFVIAFLCKSFHYFFYSGYIFRKFLEYLVWIFHIIYLRLDFFYFFLGFKIQNILVKYYSILFICNLNVMIIILHNLIASNLSVLI